MDFFGHGNEMKERSPRSIKGLVESGFIDESGQLTERTRRAIPREGVEILTPIKVLEDGELVDPKLSREVQDSCFVIADGVIVGGVFLISPGLRWLNITAASPTMALLPYAKILCS